MSSAVQHEIKAIQEAGEEICNAEEQRFPEAASPGDSWRQGDVYITLLGGLPNGAETDPNPQRQLVPGTTQGSRHCLDGLGGVIIHRLRSPGPLDGPILECQQEATITHPEHGNVVLPPGIYGIHYQRDLDAEERERRVLD